MFRSTKRLAAGLRFGSGTKPGLRCFEQTINRSDDKVRLKLNLADLTDGTYQLEVSNGVETTVRAVTIATNEPSAAARNIVLL